MKIRAGIELANMTDAGCERENNEDYFSYYEPDSDEAFLRIGRLALVADGMGGAQAGEVASRLAADKVREVYISSQAVDPRDRLIEGFTLAHETVADVARNNPECQGMGTTCTAVAIHRDNAYFAHVGDSRLYLLRDSAISCLTYDHTAINHLIEKGAITQDEAVGHPQQHILTAALGISSDVKADVSESPIPLMVGDVLMLCTDGLWNQLGDPELFNIIKSSVLGEACKELVEAAKKRGGFDNITVQLLSVTGV
jgi:serine/threonine protein phosphatase PrpC